MYEKIIFENLEKGFQYRLTINEFRETEYLHVRKYFLSYEGDWVPTKEGASVPASIQNTYALLDGLLDICSRSENADVVSAYLTKKISELNPVTE